MKMSTWKIAIATFAALATMIVPAQAGNPNCTEVDGDYIVSFPRGANLGNEMKAAAGRQIETKFTYDSVLNGFAATLTAEQACAFKKRPGAIVERDSEATTTVSRAVSSTLWGLDRIDQRTPNLDGNLNTDTSGVGVNVYVLDTGINTKHTQFTSRIGAGFSTVGKGVEDCNGHGTHVSGTVGGRDFGVANGVTLYPIRVLGCNGSGSWSGIISGIDWVAKNKKLPAVASMSIGGGLSATVNTAVQNLINSNVTVVVAAGNSATDACKSSPASAPNAITVGAITKQTNADVLASYSNIGDCVDIYAPGTNIFSAWIKGTTATNVISGTSMATPHVTGIVARFPQSNPSATPAQVTSAVFGARTSSNGMLIACLTGAGECSTN